MASRGTIVMIMDIGTIWEIHATTTELMINVTLKTMNVVDRSHTQSIIVIKDQIMEL